MQRGKYKFVVIKDGERFRKKIRAPSPEVAEQSLARKGYRVVKLLTVLEEAGAAQAPKDHATTLPEPPSDPDPPVGARDEAGRPGSADADLGPSGGGAVLVAGVLLVLVAVVVLVVVGPWREAEAPAEDGGAAAGEDAAAEETPSADLIGGSAATGSADGAETDPDAGRGQREPAPRR